MKHLFLAGLFIVCSSSLWSEVILTFEDPESFSDFEYAQTRRTISTEFFGTKVVPYLEKALEKSFQQGAVLKIHFADIDLAGGFEPWQKIPLDDVRFYRNRYPPVVKFTYRLEDGSGKLLSEGEVLLRDYTYLDGSRLNKGVIDPFYHEHRMMDNWITTKLRKAVKLG